MQVATRTDKSAGIFCKDMRLSRLLAIQLDMCGVTQVVDGWLDPVAVENCFLWVVDVDDFPLDSLPTPSLLCHIWAFSRAEESVTLWGERQVHIWHRPFAMTLFEDLVKGWMQTWGDTPAEDDKQGEHPLLPSVVVPPLPAEHDDTLRVVVHGVVAVGEVQVALTPQEWVIFARLWKSRGRAVTKGELQALLNASESSTPTTNKLEVYICFLRRKLEKPTGRRLIETVRGVGYLLVEG